MARRALPVLALLVLLVACAAPGPLPRAADFPSHAPAAPFFTLHWRVDRAAGHATAEGVVDVSAPDMIMDVTVELQGLDAAGRVVSRSSSVANARTFDGRDPWPFTVRLRLRGPEERFALRVTDYRLKTMRGGIS